MQFSCRAVDLTFMDSAPLKFVNEVEINASPDQVFKVFEDEASWPKWFKDIVKVEWTSPKPFGVDTTRAVTLKAMTVYEKFIVWDPGKRFTFNFSATTMPFAHALLEDYLLEPVGNGKTKLIYTVALEPRLLIKSAGPIGKWILGKMFKDGAQSLVSYMAENP